MYFHQSRFLVFQVADGHVVFLCLNIKQAVDGNTKVISPHIRVVDGNTDVFLLFLCVIEQSLHLVTQKTVIGNAGGNYRHKNPDNHRPIHEHEEQLKIYRGLEDTCNKQVIANTDKDD